MPNCTAVASSSAAEQEAAVAGHRDDQGRSGIATLTPSAVGKPALSVPEKPEVISVRGAYIGRPNQET